MRWTTALLLLLTGPACLCPRQSVTQPQLDGRILDEAGGPRPDAQAELCLVQGTGCSRVEVSSAATYHLTEKSETEWGCLCLPGGHRLEDYVLRVSAPDALPVEVAAEGAGLVVLRKRPVELAQARQSLLVLYRSPQGFAVVFSPAWVQEAAGGPNFALRVATPGSLVEEALEEVERSGVVQPGNVVPCRAGVAQLVTETQEPFLIRYGPTWYLVRNPPKTSPLRRLLARLQPSASESHDDAPAALALSRQDAERVAQEVCGAAVGAPGGVAWLRL